MINLDLDPLIYELYLYRSSEDVPEKQNEHIGQGFQKFIVYYRQTEATTNIYLAGSLVVNNNAN